MVTLKMHKAVLIKKYFEEKKFEYYSLQTSFLQSIFSLKMHKAVLIKKYFEEKKLVESNIQSYNNLIEKGLQEVIEENKEAEPAIIPHNIEKFKIRFGRITVGKPEITEADGSKRNIYPMEARLRKISY